MLWTKEEIEKTPSIGEKRGGADSDIQSGGQGGPH